MSDRVSLNGREPTLAELARLAQVNYGHFTTLRIRDRAAQGFARHLERLAVATRALFGAELDAEAVRAQLRELLDDTPCVARITVGSLGFDRAQPERPVPCDVLIGLRPWQEPHGAPVKVCSVVHQRVQPQFKHVGTFDLFAQRRMARERGFDDALFVDAHGEIAEGTVWNIGLVDDSGIVWPSAPALAGIGRALLDSGLRARGMPTREQAIFLRDLGAFRSAFAVNALGVGPLIAAIDEHVFAEDAALLAELKASLAMAPWEPV